MSDRPVNLDVGAGANQRANAQTSQSHSGGTRDRPAEDQVDRFRHALSGQPELDESGQPPPLESPFALFGVTRVASNDAAGRIALLASEIADRILVSEDDPHEARIAIRDDVMTGVEVRIVRDQGRWVITFTITDSESFQLLERSGEKIAGELAQRLRSEVQVQLIDVWRSTRTPVCVFNAVPDDGDVGGLK